jgi:hypothetical protein
MGDELVARAAQLVGVTVAGEIEGPGQGGTVDLGRIELLDNGEEVGEKPSLL